MRKTFDYPNIPLVEERFWNEIKRVIDEAEVYE